MRTRRRFACPLSTGHNKLVRDLPGCVGADLSAKTPGLPPRDVRYAEFMHRCFFSDLLGG
ncbi:hypothetical protein KPSA1_00120 [Pseudomonas syringae pv. actinidiae]|uniref:Uncharacterized protein n=1 Tax=Pseudomonas syringae pv. actinidiae TaxID=103796 RepID=A0A2V0Q8T1_PSESF|nr:hypothetical protein KPSA1_00120 [Pseudomonas syringae pv. actinidiae]